MLARELYPGKFRPTISHAFISLLAKKGLLYKLFTQNIDCLERAAGVPSDVIIECHGSFATQRCIECRESFPDDAMRDHVERGEVPRCKCRGLVKPDIVFFGEGLPMEFSRNSYAMTEADLVLVIGTSLTVYPFASLPDLVRPKTPRVLFNRERVGAMGSRGDDVLELGPCDTGIQKLAEELGWLDELNALWEKTVGTEEVKRQRVRQGVSGERQLEEAEEDLVEAITARVEGIELKGEGEESGEGAGAVNSEEKPEAGDEEDKEVLRADSAPGDAESAKDGVGEGLKDHLEMHLHQKTGPVAPKSGLSEEASTQGSAAREDKPVEGKTEEKPSEEKTEQKPAEGETEEKPTEKKTEEGPDEIPKGQEKL